MAEMTIENDQHGPIVRFKLYLQGQPQHCLNGLVRASGRLEFTLFEGQPPVCCGPDAHSVQGVWTIFHFGGGLGGGTFNITSLNVSNDGKGKHTFSSGNVIRNAELRSDKMEVLVAFLKGTHPLSKDASKKEREGSQRICSAGTARRCCQTAVQDISTEQSSAEFNSNVEDEDETDSKEDDTICN